MTRRKYTLTVSRFQPMKNTRINSDGLKEKNCTKCKEWKIICYENWAVDSSRGDGRSHYRSWCRCCLRKGTNEWVARNHPTQSNNLP